MSNLEITQNLNSKNWSVNDRDMLFHKSGNGYYNSHSLTHMCYLQLWAQVIHDYVEDQNIPCSTNECLWVDSPWSLISCQEWPKGF